MSKAEIKQFEVLYAQYQAMVYQLCLGFTKGEEDIAKDVSQEVFIHVWNGLAKFKGNSTYKTWIYRITVNTCLLSLRMEKRLQVEAIDGKEVAAEAAPEVDPNYKVLYSAIGKLNEVDRVLVMLLLDELSYDEIADVLGLQLGNLRVKIHRVKERLKKIIDNG
jgi:RNA polymerase sigma-70 factor (ECF subfamily)